MVLGATASQDRRQQRWRRECRLTFLPFDIGLGEKRIREER